MQERCDIRKSCLTDVLSRTTYKYLPTQVGLFHDQGVMHKTQIDLWGLVLCRELQIRYPLTVTETLGCGVQTTIDDCWPVEHHLCEIWGKQLYERSGKQCTSLRIRIAPPWLGRFRAITSSEILIPSINEFRTTLTLVAVG